MGPIGDLSLDWLVESATRIRRFGVEHEFSVSRGDRAVDFRSMVSAASVPGRRLDRSDPFARRLPWGGVVTADGPEAECATPPASLEPGFTDRINHWAEIGRRELQSMVHDAELSGYSTHLNVEVDDRRAVALARRFAARHSAALMLLADGADSPGLLVRPRRSRLELGAEYVTGDQLVAASVFAAAATRDCESTRRASLLAAPHVVPARGRFGLFVDRAAFGSDLSALGRAARVGRGSAQDLLTWSWDRCRIHALEFAAPHEIAVVDGMVDGTRPLPSELRSDVVSRDAPRRADAGSHLDVTVARRSGAMQLEPILATWDHVCFLLLVGGTSRVIAVRAEAAERLVRAFESGELDAWCHRIANVDPRTLAVLSSADQIGQSAGVFSSVDPDATLMPPERNPRTGRPGGVGNPPGQRQQKNHDDTPPRRMWHKQVAVAAVAGAVVIAGAVAVASRDDTPARSAATPTTAAPVPVTTADETTVAAAVVPVTDAATTTTAAPVPVCSAVDLSPTVEAGAVGVSDSGPSPLLPGTEVTSDGTGYAEVQFGTATTRIDTNTAVTCADAMSLTQTGGRTWTRTGADPVLLHTPEGDVSLSPGSVAVVDCRTAPGCTILLIRGSASLADGQIVNAPSATSLAPAAVIQPLTYDAAFGDPWIADNALRDVAAGNPGPADIYQSYGPATASLAGQFNGQRTVTAAECTAGPCDVGPPVGDVAPRTYNFSFDCSSTPCVGTVQAEFQVDNVTQIAEVPLAFDGTSYTWDINNTGYQCTFDTDGNGTYESQLGTSDLTIHYTLAPTAAEVRNGQYVVTAFHATADANNTVAIADPRCVGTGGPSRNSGDITASR